MSCLLNRSLRKGGRNGFKGCFCIWHGAALREGTSGSMGHVPTWDTASPRTLTRAHLPRWELHRYRGSALPRVHSTQCKPALPRGLLHGQWHGFPRKDGSPDTRSSSNRTADGTVLLQMEGDLGLKLWVEPSAKY